MLTFKQHTHLPQGLRWQRQAKDQPRHLSPLTEIKWPPSILQKNKQGWPNRSSSSCKYSRNTLSRNSLVALGIPRLSLVSLLILPKKYRSGLKLRGSQANLIITAHWKKLALPLRTDAKIDLRQSRGCLKRESKLRLYSLHSLQKTQKSKTKIKWWS